MGHQGGFGSPGVAVVELHKSVFILLVRLGLHIMCILWLFLEFGSDNYQQLFFRSISNNFRVLATCRVDQRHTTQGLAERTLLFSWFSFC